MKGFHAEFVSQEHIHGVAAVETVRSRTRNFLLLDRTVYRVVAPCSLEEHLLCELRNV